MKAENISRANEIIQELRDLVYFTEQINSRYGRATSMVIKKNVETSYSILGSRNFVIGKHVQEIKVPESLIIEIDLKVLEIKKDLEEELKTL